MGPVFPLGQRSAGESTGSLDRLPAPTRGSSARHPAGRSISAPRDTKAGWGFRASGGHSRYIASLAPNPTQQPATMITIEYCTV